MAFQLLSSANCIQFSSNTTSSWEDYLESFDSWFCSSFIGSVRVVGSQGAVLTLVKMFDFLPRERSLLSGERMSLEYLKLSWSSYAIRLRCMASLFCDSTLRGLLDSCWSGLSPDENLLKSVRVLFSRSSRSYSCYSYCETLSLTWSKWSNSLLPISSGSKFSPAVPLFCWSSLVYINMI